MQKAVALALVALLVAPAAKAGESAWIELAPGVNIRLISSDVVGADGVTLGGIEIDMPDATKTYWKIPGETGIPTAVSLAGSEGIAEHKTRWPYPKIDVSGGYTDFVYYGPTVFPVEMKVEGNEVVWHADVSLGICSDVCIPAEAKLSLPLKFDKADRGHGLRINQALSLAPVPWDADVEAIAEVFFDIEEQVLEVTLGSNEIDPNSLIADIGDSSLIFGAPQKSRDGTVVRLPLLGGKGQDGLTGRSIQFTFLTDQGAFTTSRLVVASSDGAL